MRSVLLAAWALVSVVLIGARPSIAAEISTPLTSGDQLLFFYDTTGARVPFLVVSTLGEREEFVEIRWTSEDVGTVLFDQQISLLPGVPLILDPQQIPEVQGHLGLVVVTPVLNMFNPVPIVPSSPLYGGFTLADTAVGSGFGQNPFARRAVTANGRPAAPGARVDGEDVLYQRLAADYLTVPFFFDPTSPGLTDRVLVAAFRDEYDATGHRIVSEDTRLFAEFSTASEGSVDRFTVSVDGVASQSLGPILREEATSSGSGRLTLASASPAGNRMALFSQSLGTFAVGQRLPGSRTVADGRVTTAEPAVVVSDQQSLEGVSENTSFPGGYFAQTFTVGVTGTLVRIDVVLLGALPGPEPLVLELRPAVGDAFSVDPDDVFFASSVPVADLVDAGPERQIARFDLTSLDLPARAGDRLAYVLRRDTAAGGTGVGTSTIQSGYPGGNAFFGDDGFWTPLRSTDFLFETFVRVP